jgi:hypothetical protein
LPETLTIVLLGAASLRVLGSVIGGLLSVTAHADTFPVGSQRVGTVLTRFGAAGDTASALLVVGAVAILGWALPEARASALAPLARLLALATGVLVVLRVAGVLAIEADFSSHPAAEEVVQVAFAAGDLLLCLGGVVALGRMGGAAQTTGDALEPLVFAVDRGNGEVFAFFSYAQAARTISVYSIEEHEYDFFAEDGTALSAAVVDDRTTFSATDDDRRDELMQHLRRFAQAKSIDVTDRDDPAAYAVPIADWQWLELWPGWLRGIGRFVRRLRG